MIFGIDGTVVCDLIHFFSFGADLGNCILWCFLEQVDDAIHNIDEDHLEQGKFSRGSQDVLPELSGPRSLLSASSQQRSPDRCFLPQNERLFST